MEDFASRMELDEGESVRLSEPSLEISAEVVTDFSQGYRFRLDETLQTDRSANGNCNISVCSLC